MNRLEKQIPAKTEDRLQIEGFETAEARADGASGTVVQGPRALVPRSEKARILRVGQNARRSGDALPAEDQSARLLERVYEDVAELKQGMRDQIRGGPAVDGAAATGTLESIDARLKGISQSVEFTEAYMAVGFTTRIGEMLKEETAASQKAAMATLRSKRRLKVALLLVAALAGLLAAEMTGDTVSTVTTELTRQFEIVVLPRIGEMATLLIGAMADGQALVKSFLQSL